MPPSLPIAAARLAFSYSEGEDRILLLGWDAQQNGVSTAMTRRLTNGLVNGLAHLLERSNMLASTAPADLRGDIILMEHQDALYGGTQDAPAGEETEVKETPQTVPAPFLVHAVDVNITPQTFEILFRDLQNPLIRLSLTRPEVHRIVEALTQRAQAAGWNMSVEAAWLDPAQTEIVFN
jgi:hypothetical protein